MIAFWIFLGGIALYIIGSIIEWFGKAAQGESNLGCLYLLVLPLAIVLLPIKLALDMMSSGRGRRKRR